MNYAQCVNISRNSLILKILNPFDHVESGIRKCYQTIIQKIASDVKNETFLSMFSHTVFSHSFLLACLK